MHSYRTVRYANELLLKYKYSVNNSYMLIIINYNNFSKKLYNMLDNFLLL